MPMMVNAYQYNTATPHNNNILLYTKLLYEDSTFHRGKSFDHETGKL